MFSIGHADKRLRPESVDAVLIMCISKSCKNALVRPGIVTKHTLAVKQAISMMPGNSCTWPKKWRDIYSRVQERQMRVSDAYSIGALSVPVPVHRLCLCTPIIGTSLAKSSMM